MITLVEPKGYITRLWGKQPINDVDVYRLMRYVIRTDYEDRVLLQNVVTGQLVVLESYEARLLKSLPVPFDPMLSELIESKFLVPEHYDEHQQVLKLRKILRIMDDAQGTKPVLHVTILPTTACNARCYYCFEQGTEISTMSEKTANEVVEYMAAHCGKEKTVVITWFGGEPTVAATRIDQICKGLQKKGIKYRSKMMTNGYLFDSDMVAKAKNLWNLYAVQICVDGIGDTYNQIKAFATVDENPYERVMRNIGSLLDNEIYVGLRMNFDLGNYQEFSGLVDEVESRFGTNKYLYLTAHPVIGEYKDCNGRILHADDDWFAEKIVELNDISFKRGLRSIKYDLPFLDGDGCSASTGNSITIRPDGGISRCAELFGDEDIVGTIHEGVVNHERDRSWKIVADYDMCVECVFYPFCVRLANCPNKSYCHKMLTYKHHYEAEVIKKIYDIHKGVDKKEEVTC